MSKLISFDVSSVSTGWAIFENKKLIDFGKIIIDKKYTVQERLFYFKKNIEFLLITYLPSVVLVEETYLRNVMTLKTLVQFMTIVNIVSFEILHLPLILINPNTVRSYYNVKTKEEAFDYVKNRYKAKFKKYNFNNGNDITDAVLQGIYWLEGRNDEEDKKSKKKDKKSIRK